MAKNLPGCLWLLLPLAGMASGETSLSGPVAGYVAAASGPELRAVLGVPGSFRFSDPLNVPREITRIRVAPTQAFALVEGAGAGLGILPFDTLDRVTPVEGSVLAADWVAFSPSAGSAILFSSAAHRLQVLSGLPGAPRLTLDVDAALLPAEPATGGVSDDGSIRLIASGQALYLVAPDGTARLLLSGEFASVAMLRNGAAAVSDRSGSIHLLRNLAGAPASQTLASGLAGLDQLYGSSDGGTVWAARPAANTVCAIDIDSGELREFETQAAPISLAPMRNRDTFLISAEPGQPAWVFFRDGAGARAVFVPAVNPPEDAARRARRRQ